MAPAKHTLPFVTVDAFATRPFSGNPASVLVFPLGDDKLQQLAHDDALMQQVAAEFNLSETAYCRELEGGTEDEPRYELRWRTPVAEVMLCGHATIASAHTLFSDHHPGATSIRFETRFSGTLFARRRPPPPPPSSSPSPDPVGLISLDFPSAPAAVLPTSHPRHAPTLAALTSATTPALTAAHVVRVAYYAKWDHTIVEFVPGVDLAQLAVRSDALVRASTRVVLTQPARGPPFPARDGEGEGEVEGEDDADIRSRVFAHPLGIDEDPVTGAAHTALAVFWLDRGPEALARLGLDPGGGGGKGERRLRARQVSRRGGEMEVVLDREGERVELRGRGTRVMRGVLEL
ncbi:hypothetical protein JCM8208_001759 [Rhodotorula glutinis]